MDVYDATKIVMSRIQSLDPENATKIMGLLLLQDNGEKEMIRLALGPESLLHSLVLRARKDLGLCLGPISPVDELSPFGLGWMPCLYFARGFCKNGSGCRFVHGVSSEEDELVFRSRLGSVSSGFSCSPTGSSLPNLSPWARSKCLSLLIQQQQMESQRIAEAAVARARLDPVARQIYLTFPADSTFREEDVSNYFSIYGPVQDVRIPFQQKRMFGFVTFVYPETVKLILAKGNPHFVCDSRVLVKPYKEKGKVCEKKSQQGAEFVVCTTPTGLNLDSRGEAFEFQQFGAKMICNTNNSNHELLLRKKLEEQQQALELQKAIDMQQRRFMGLHLLDLKNRNIATAPVPINNVNPMTSNIDSSSSSNSSNGSLESPLPEYKSPNGDAAIDKKVNGCHGILKETTIVAADKEESNLEADPKDDGDYQESFGHNLPDSPFASPKKSSIVSTHFAANEVDAAPYNGLDHAAYGVNKGNSTFGHTLIASTILPTSSTIDMAPLKACYFQMPRFSDHGAIGM